MKTLLLIGNEYAENSDWKDFALTKMCLCAMGVLIGLNIPARKKSCTAKAAGVIFGVTYVILMTKVFKIVKNMLNS